MDTLLIEKNLKNILMSTKSKPKLTVELVPTTCHFSNVRSTVTTAEWDKIRRISYEAANNVCEICKDTGKNQGYKHNVECHEIWHYNDETHVQTLTGLISLCPTCHQVKHIGRSIAIGIEKQCYYQLAKINKWTIKQIQEHIVKSFEVHKERSKHQWTLDISILKSEPYNVDIKDTTERIFEVKKFKKKKKKKVAGAPKKLHPKAKLAAALKPKPVSKKKPNKK
jgi:hypothetical protein